MAGMMQAESSGAHGGSVGGPTGGQPGGHPLPGPRISHGDHRLVAAARDGGVKKLRKLLQKHGVNVNARDAQTGNTALMVASLVQDADVSSTCPPYSICLIFCFHIFYLIGLLSE